MVSMLYDQTTKFSATSFVGAAAAAPVGAGAAAGAVAAGAAVGAAPHAAMSKANTARTPAPIHSRLTCFCGFMIPLLSVVQATSHAIEDGYAISSLKSYLAYSSIGHADTSAVPAVRPRHSR